MTNFQQPRKADPPKSEEEKEGEEGGRLQRRLSWLWLVRLQHGVVAEVGEQAGGASAHEHH